MRSARTRSLPVALLLSAIVLLVSAASAAAASIPAGGVAIDHASLDWTGSQVMQTAPPFGGSNYFSAGVSDGTEATYSAQTGNVAVYQVSSTDTETLATYGTRAEHITSGGKQLIRLSDGVGKVEADGSAKVDWTGSFSVNFYGGLAPFTITDPELSIAADGKGELIGTIAGCEGSMGGGACEPLPSAPVTVATFSGIQVNPEEALTVTPDYAGVEVEATPAQNRTATGWGAWPQSMVSYQVETGLSSYFYSSGSGSDSKKPPLPFTVDFKGKIPAVVTPPVTTPEPVAPISTPLPKAKVGVLKGTQMVGSNGVVKLASLICPIGGAACKTVIPKHVGARIGGERYLIGVIAPKTIGAGKSAAVRAKLPKGARAALGDGKLTITLPIKLKANGSVIKKTLKVKIAGKH
jgi:hypothetical protein